MELDEQNKEIFNMYALIRNQLRVTPMGDIMGLDYGAVLHTIKLYVNPKRVRHMFELMLLCNRIEQENSR